MTKNKVISRLKPPRRRYFFKEWRKHRGLTQEQLVGRMIELISYELSVSSISQLETGKQGFSNETLEALAVALDCNPGDLLMRNPLDTEAPWSLWDQLQPAQKRQALAVLDALARTGTDG